MTARGHNFTGKDYDAHVRLENLEGEKQIVVDVFNSKIKKADKAHVNSVGFDEGSEGLREAQDYLAGYGIPAS